MATTFNGEGDIIQYAAASAISSGDIVLIGSMVCVALADIASGATGNVRCTGEWYLPKITGAITVGALVDYDLSALACGTGITEATGDISDFGICVAAAGSGDATVLVRLLPGKGAVT